MIDLNGRLDRGTLHSEVILPSLEPLVKESRKMTYENLRIPNPVKGVAQLFYPGPVVVWYSLGREGEHHVRIYHNGGDVKLAEELGLRLANYDVSRIKES